MGRGVVEFKTPAVETEEKVNKEELRKYCEDNDIDQTPMTNEELSVCVLVAGKQLTQHTELIKELIHTIEVIGNKLKEMEVQPPTHKDVPGTEKA